MGLRTRLGRAAMTAAALLLATTACRAAAGSAEQPSTSTSPSTSPTASGPASAGGCHVADLTATVGEFGSMASQPFLTVKLTNHTSSACRLRGYPLLTVVGSFVDPPGRPVHAVVSHGSTYERADPGPHTIVVAPHRFASFTIGTATAYNGPQAKLHRFEIRLATADHPLMLRQEMPANGPHKVIPVTETALWLDMRRR